MLVLRALGEPVMLLECLRASQHWPAWVVINRTGAEKHPRCQVLRRTDLSWTSRLQPCIQSGCFISALHAAFTNDSRPANMRRYWPCLVDGTPV